MALQAAAAREYPATHPVQRAASVRLYHEQRHEVLQTVLHHHPTEVSIPSLGTDNRNFKLSPDFTARAVQGTRTPRLLTLTDKASDAVLREWTLPDAPGGLWYASGEWGWTQDGRFLMLPWGAPWQDEFGFVTLDAHNGACTFERLPTYPKRPAFNTCYPCSNSGSVAVRHPDAAGSLVVSVFDSSGAQIQSAPCPESRHLRSTWGPGGQALALQSQDSLWLWVLAASAPVRVASHAVSVLAWATPYTGRMMVVQQLDTPSRPWTRAVLEFASASSQPAEACVLQAIAGAVTSLAWGTRLAVVTADHDECRWGTLQVFALQGPVSSLVASYLPCACVGAVSSDGGLLAAVSGVEEEEEVYDELCTMNVPHLMVMHLSSGRLNQWPLREPLKLGGDLHLRWALDSTAVLVTDEEGRSVLFSF